MPEHPFDPHSDDDSEHRPQNPFAGTPFEQVFGNLAGGDPAGLQAVFGQLQRMFTPHEGAINWELSRDLARQTLAATDDRSPDGGDAARLNDVATLAEHWLDGVTDLPATTTTVAAWSRADWIEQSMPMWKQLVEPVAESVVGAMSKALPPEAQAMAGPMMGMLTQIGGAMFSQQIGQAIGALSQEVVSATDIGFPVGDAASPAIVVTNARGFGEGLDISDSDVLLYLVLRECAHQRLYAHTPWLRDYLFSAIADYGHGINIDTSSIEEQMRGFDPSNLAGLQEALSGCLFDLAQTPAQSAALNRLETALTLIEGWVDEVVGQATDKVMPQAQALREAIRRRRATGGPAEVTFAALVGLELRPRRLRDASALWGALRAAEGAAARDALWAHSDLLPTAADLDDPLAFAERTREADDLDVDSPEFDAQLAAMIEGELDASDTPADDVVEPSDHSNGSDGSDDSDDSDSSAGESGEAGPPQQ
ncbi:MAG: zinc-dependent metalloprotease [Nocardioidaceae bacterium]